MVNGVGYKAHWSACDLFVQCVIAADGSATVSIRQCPHGLHWDQVALTCNRPSLAACPQDMCRQPGYVVYPATSNCRGFWACEGGVSEGKCCPPGYAFSMDGECVPSPPVRIPVVWPRLSQVRPGIMSSMSTRHVQRVRQAGGGDDAAGVRAVRGGGGLAADVLRPRHRLQPQPVRLHRPQPRRL
ncbi:hypothetical protein C0Q70_05300 [Pomacea canaliculata]|uniref:Chitin-binding type-2 domain-containing protein n=1 Tax=Pomacea canaliculata TaxID=400727 RepID=A0A2T7PKU4_POMCA|nr:hypothetical protein C0Q70_05300 [Pomacea canaliculata]